ncbi:MAG: hypothetical protein GY820_04525 [Gammaproteobacteria bacterium]|nr:hypothetical protein [Gammaproteobacteria bacterium]
MAGESVGWPSADALLVDVGTTVVVVVDSFRDRFPFVDPTTTSSANDPSTLSHIKQNQSPHFGPFAHFPKSAKPRRYQPIKKPSGKESPSSDNLAGVEGKTSLSPSANEPRSSPPMCNVRETFSFRKRSDQKEIEGAQQVQLILFLTLPCPRFTRRLYDQLALTWHFSLAVGVFRSDAGWSIEQKFLPRHFSRASSDQH